MTHSTDHIPLLYRCMIVYNTGISPSYMIYIVPKDCEEEVAELQETKAGGRKPVTWSPTSGEGGGEQD